jgi:hypothetical protein
MRAAVAWQVVPDDHEVSCVLPALLIMLHTTRC